MPHSPLKPSLYLSPTSDKHLTDPGILTARGGRIMREEEREGRGLSVPSYTVRWFDCGRVIVVFVVFLVLISALNSSTSSAYTTDTNVYTPPDYLTFQPPDAGGSYIDPVFGSGIKRLTNAMTVPDAARGSGVVTAIAPEYSTMTPFNQDNTRLLLTHFSYFGLYDGARKFS
jgi:hypothetical protein